MTTTHRQGSIISAGTLTGEQVRNMDGEDLGKIEEIMLEAADGRIAYAVLSFGGFLGMGNKLFAVPWPALSLDPAREGLILNVDKATLEAAPGFDKDDWPRFADRSWGTEIHSYYGYEPYWS